MEEPALDQIAVHAPLDLRWLDIVQCLEIVADGRLDRSMIPGGILAGRGLRAWSSEQDNGPRTSGAS